MTLTARDRSIIFDEIAEQLSYQPLVEMKNRKPLRPNPIAPWELRIGKLRVFYEVVSGQPNVVRILAVGKKERNRLLIGGQEIDL
ncbi:MAG: type II toxin-antitoxin system RelE/ParE family toxin [Candidatus Hydrogenedentes bacterium]|nr:type II toxin-antitoxin system RelE/ParE family toxin [Candidatus Hydrogenedentota bacterium]